MERELIKCQECKRSLVKFLSTYFLNIQTHLLPQQTLGVVGGFDSPIIGTAWFVTGNQKAQPNPQFTSNTEETDTRLWLHICRTRYSRIFIMSPDTHMYNIGLPLDSKQRKEIVVQISRVSSRELKLLKLRSLLSALQNDPDLAHIEPAILPQVSQALYVSTWCDYVSFFSQMGKLHFYGTSIGTLRSITGRSNVHTPGTLADTGIEGGEYIRGFLAFMRLVGTKNIHLPLTHPHLTLTCFNSSLRTQLYCNNIRPGSKTCDSALGIESHSRTSPFHRTRLSYCTGQGLAESYICGVRQIRTQCLQPITNYGWDVSDSKLTMVWDTPENTQAIQNRVSLLLKGCKCVTGCTTRRCSCKKNERAAGCQCRNCSNTGIQMTSENTSELAEIAVEEEISTSKDVTETNC